MESASKKNYEAPAFMMPTWDLFRQQLHSHPTDGWQKCWEEGLTPWDLGQTTPIIQHLLQTDALPKGRALVPGCGRGYDVIAMACPERCVVGLDLSKYAITKANEFASSSPNVDNLQFILDDFFTWQPTHKFDLIYDYTFFSAIEPRLRIAWAKRMGELLKPDGELITLIFPISNHVGGPPYKVSVFDYEEVLGPKGFKAVSITDNYLATESRKGYEKLGRWKKIPGSDGR